MTRCNVTDFVAEHDSQLSFVIEVSPALRKRIHRECKSIYNRAVKNPEGELCIPEFGTHRVGACGFGRNNFETLFK